MVAGLEGCCLAFVDDVASGLCFRAAWVDFLWSGRLWRLVARDRFSFAGYRWIWWHDAGGHGAGLAFAMPGGNRRWVRCLLVPPPAFVWRRWRGRWPRSRWGNGWLRACGQPDLSCSCRISHILMAPNVTRTAANSAANQNTRLGARTIGHTFVIVDKITHRMQIGISRATPFHLAPKRSDPAA